MSVPIVSLHSLEPVRRPSERRPTVATADRFDASFALFSERLGLNKLGCNLTAVLPAKSAFPPSGRCWHLFRSFSIGGITPLDWLGEPFRDEPGTRVPDPLCANAAAALRYRDDAGRGN